MRTKSIVLFMVLFFVLGIYSPAFAASQPVMTLEEVEALIDASPNKEISAVFLSVPRGIQKSRYNIILRGVYRGLTRKAIMFTMTGPIVGGMSGSPVYIGNKLIGAVAFRNNNFNFNEYSWGGISPISLMILESQNRRSSSSGSGDFVYLDKVFNPIETVYASTHPSVSANLSSYFNFGLEAGMPIAVELMEWTDEKGETTVYSAVGTITYIDDNGRVFAFGHPFMNSKDVVYGFRTAEIMGTAFSQQGSSKLAGKHSEILGVIDYDSTYGVYGHISLKRINELHNFKLDFKLRGVSFHSFDIKIADSIMTPSWVKDSFNIIGQVNGAPLPQDPGVTEIEAIFEIDSYNSIIWNESFSSQSIVFGVDTLYISSYDNAINSMLARIYTPIFNSNYGFSFGDVSVTVNFIPGKVQPLKLGELQVPAKVVWGDDIIFKIRLVAEDNSIALEGNIKVNVDWDKVEKPIYTADVRGTDKMSEKIINGQVDIYGERFFQEHLTSSQKLEFDPSYYLNAEDYLEVVSQRLQITSQRMFGKVLLRRVVDVDDSSSGANSQVQTDSEAIEQTNEWQVIEGGVNEKETPIVNTNTVEFLIEFPQTPSGYIVWPNIHHDIWFEVVLGK